MSNVWDKYKSTVRTHISVPEGRTLITENQWKAKHFIKVDEQSGKYLWVNANCPFKKAVLVGRGSSPYDRAGACKIPSRRKK